MCFSFRAYSDVTLGNTPTTLGSSGEVINDSKYQVLCSKTWHRAARAEVTADGRLFSAQKNNTRTGIDRRPLARWYEACPWANASTRAGTPCGEEKARASLTTTHRWAIDASVTKASLPATPSGVQAAYQRR